MTNFKIQIVSDTVCPWCYVGHRRLSRAIATHKQSHPNDTFSITWHAFYLNPGSPFYPGVDKRQHYVSKFGAQTADAMFARLTAVGAEEGIAFKFGGRTGRTRNSHRLIAYAGKKSDGNNDGLQTRVVEALFKAYFEEEKNITDRAVLLEAGVKAGLPEAEVEKVLDSDECGAEVDADAERARRRFISGVPHFTIQEKYAVGGAESPDAFLEVFDAVKRDEK
ncbi:thioredoxin [Paecilomyces variotii]|uniref:Thioredoxin n=1 Tax=Byssochlamys spectabilis TaxID=264951 RepID=A0A443I2C2_BYSSP|nr:thioredoxin [Paecilomyces variotii]KAJ9267212.1 hypothetical protein DTO195F2_445 [Paecilomyces variotii]KAJ9306334.1 hypothetical protein DTO217A2_4073 [Paecilomyces variotii]KAJ9364398.1 hypothetical protein DTO280E4_1644 [Paecilomyces variotii]KAJ9368537.1 hypothetical protein DTO282E5_6774 [Paecilomyces variotii]RWQ98198.1 thioredoxin [Paecilomyces variotii]